MDSYMQLKAKNCFVIEEDVCVCCFLQAVDSAGIHLSELPLNLCCETNSNYVKYWFLFSDKWLPCNNAKVGMENLNPR